MRTTCAIYLYGRTAPSDFRTLRASIEARGWRAVRVYRERRPVRDQWLKLEADARARRFDAVATTSMDAIGRSAADIVKAVERLRTNGVQLVLSREGIATNEPSGALAMLILSGVARLEHQTLSERAKRALNAAKARGTKDGRPRAYLSPRDIQAVRAGYRTAASLARDKGVSVMTVRRRLAEVA